MPLLIRWVALFILGLATAALVFVETRQNSILIEPAKTPTTTPAVTTTTPPHPSPAPSDAKALEGKTEGTAKPAPAVTPTIPIAAPSIQAPTTTPPVVFTPPVAPPLVPFDEEPLKKAIVRIRCGHTFGSGFVMDSNGGKYVLTAAHVVIDRLESKIYNCDVIFPRKDDNGNYKETYYLTGKILLPEETEKNYKETGIDLAALEIIPLENKSEEAAIFPNGYPFLNYPLCPPNTRGDRIILLGYSANLGTAITPGAFQSRFAGSVIQYADVSGSIKKPSKEFAGGFVYTPDFKDATDQNVQHHLSVILSDNNFAGASGGLVFNLDKNCVVGANIATLVKDNRIFGFITNPNFGPIKNFIERALKEF